MIRKFLSLLLIGLSLTAMAHGQAPQVAGNWPQWRGPNRDGISPETGLLKEWPKEGPPLLWEAEGLGVGVVPVSVAGGRIFTIGERDKEEFAIALNEKDGKEVWRARLGPAAPGLNVMRWLSQRCPTIDGDRAYFVTALGELICLEVSNGKELWRKNYRKDFDGRPGNWGFCDFPLVDGDRLICTPGSKTATLLALNKKTGEILWKCVCPGDDRCTYSTVVVAEIGGIKQYIHQLEKGIVGVAAEDGKFLWRYDKIAAPQGNIHTALLKGDLVFCSCGWGVGCALLRLSRDGDSIKVEEVYRTRHSFDSWLGGSVLIGDHVHTSEGFRIELKTGRLAEQVRRGGRVTMASADGHLYHRVGNNLVSLTAITEEGYVKRSEFKFPTVSKEPQWTTPVIVGGRLYLRDQDTLYCYDIKAKPHSRGPRPPFVPTPQDVVEKMLELADIKRTDTVVDLGCGDGRIVVTAAQKYGCTAKGYDLDKECLRRAMESVQKNQLQKQVQIIDEDIFNVDLGSVDVVMLYLWPTSNVKLIPQLEKMKRGSRIVSHAADMKGIVPDKVITVKSKDDEQERKLYLWTIPLKKEEPPK
jgi:outer membrane protein assembly factor BamB